MRIVVNGKQIVEITTNRFTNITFEQVMKIGGYDLESQEDMKRGYENEIEGFYLDDCGNYAFDFENAEMVC